MTRVRLAGRIDVDAHVRFDGNEESQSEILRVERNGDMKYSGSFHRRLSAA